VAEPEPVRLRVLKVLHGVLAATAGITRVRLGWQVWTDCRPEMLPALYLTTTAGGAATDLPARRVREVFPFAVWGYARPAPADIVPGLCEDGITITRELLLQKVLDRVGSAALEDAIRADFAAHNDGAVLVRPSAGPDTDEGLLAPYAVFRLPCEALIHRPRCVS
jgi:hypothetical protein